MFGIGFTELLLISVIAILFLGPDKLPGALVEMAKFIKNVKKTIGEAKSSLEEEMKIADLKDEALKYKKQLDDATSELQNFKNIDFDDFEDNIDYDNTSSADFPATTTEKNSNAKKLDTKDESSTTQIEPKNDTVTLKKKTKSKDKKTKKTSKDKKTKKSDS